MVFVAFYIEVPERQTDHQSTDNVPDSNWDQVFINEVSDRKVGKSIGAHANGSPKFRACEILNYNTHWDHIHICDTVLKATRHKHTDRQNQNKGFIN